MSSMPSALGGNTIASIVAGHCHDLAAPLGVVVEHLDAQAGLWQCSVDNGTTWRTVRTDLINRPGQMGLALASTARLRVLPQGGGRNCCGARIVFHAALRAPGAANGSYSVYAPEGRDNAARSITLVLSLAAINGTPPAARGPQRVRNKRALAAASMLA